MNTLNDLHKKTIGELIDIIISLQEQLQKNNELINKLQHELALAKQSQFGRKSEKELPAPEDDAFDEAIPPDNLDEITTAEENITLPEHQRKKSGRKGLPKNLPRVQVTHDIADDEKICACGYALTQIGQETYEQLHYIPAKTEIIEHIKLKYACKRCEETVTTAKMPPQPIPKSIASAGLLAHVVVSKFKDHLPLYRQEAIFKRMGVDIARNTLSYWLIKCGELCKPLYELLRANIIEYDIAYADETGVQVLKEAGRKAESQSYMWCFIGGSIKTRSIIYHYDTGRAHTVIEEVLDDFHGYLHCDGYVGYDTYASDHAVDLVGCWMHARRRFIEITKVTKKAGLAHKAVEIIGKLYKIEAHIKRLNYDPAQTYEYRQHHAKPVLLSFKSWLEEQSMQVLPKMPIGEAIRYTLHQWPKLVRYLDDGRLEIDNGLSERTIKPFVIGRKNWLFYDSVAGVEAGQILYSLMETCVVHAIEPYAYFRYIFTQLPKATLMEELEALLPYSVDPASFEK